MQPWQWLCSLFARQFISYVCGPSHPAALALLLSPHCGCRTPCLSLSCRTDTGVLSNFRSTCSLVLPVRGLDGTGDATGGWRFQAQLWSLLQGLCFLRAHASVLCELLKTKQRSGNGTISVAGYLMWWPVLHTAEGGKAKCNGAGDAVHQTYVQHWQKEGSQASQNYIGRQIDGAK